MCEVTVVRWSEPRPFDRLLPYGIMQERYGVAGFGWGVAWLDGDGRVRVHRQLGRFADEAPAAPPLRRVASTHYLIHLRRPSRLSTIQLADTQPFGDDRCAFSHNGNLKRAEELRPRYAGRLSGAADSEVGWAYFRDRLGEGSPPDEALGEVADTFGGSANLAYLDAAGRLLVRAGHESNPTWTFRLDGGAVAATGLHSADRSLFELVFSGAENAAPLPYGAVVDVGIELEG